MDAGLNRIYDFDDVMDEITLRIAKDPNASWEDIPDEVENVFSFQESFDEVEAAAMVVNLPSHVFNMAREKQVPRNNFNQVDYY